MYTSAILYDNDLVTRNEAIGHGGYLGRIGYGSGATGRRLRF